MAIVQKETLAAITKEQQPMDNWITIREAAALVKRDKSTIQKRIAKKQNRLNSKLIIGVDCKLSYGIWIVSKKRILEIYKMA